MNGFCLAVCLWQFAWQFGPFSRNLPGSLPRPNCQANCRGGSPAHNVDRKSWQFGLWQFASTKLPGRFREKGPSCQTKLPEANCQEQQSFVELGPPAPLHTEGGAHHDDSHARGRGKKMLVSEVAVLVAVVVVVVSVCLAPGVRTTPATEQALSETKTKMDTSGAQLD